MRCKACDSRLPLLQDPDDLCSECSKVLWQIDNAVDRRLYHFYALEQEEDSLFDIVESEGVLRVCNDFPIDSD